MNWELLINETMDWLTTEEDTEVVDFFEVDTENWMEVK